MLLWSIIVERQIMFASVIMNTFGKNGLIGLGIGATAGAGVVGFLIYREVSRKRNEDPDEPQASSSTVSPNEVDGQHTPALDVQGMKAHPCVSVIPMQVLFTWQSLSISSLLKIICESGLSLASLGGPGEKILVDHNAGHSFSRNIDGLVTCILASLITLFFCVMLC